MTSETSICVQSFAKNHLVTTKNRHLSSNFELRRLKTQALDDTDRNRTVGICKETRDGRRVWMTQRNRTVSICKVLGMVLGKSAEAAQRSMGLFQKNKTNRESSGSDTSKSFGCLSSLTD